MGRFSETLMEHFTSPRNTGTLEHPDRVGLVGRPGEGAFFLLHLRLDAGRIAEVRFQTYGCGTTIAAGSMLSELILGRTLDECRLLTADILILELDGVPPDKMHCPALAIAALQVAVEGVVIAPQRSPDDPAGTHDRA